MTVFEQSAKANSAAGASRRQLLLDFVRNGKMDQAGDLASALLDEELEGRRWLADEIVSAMEGRDLAFAGSLAAVLTGIERGSEWYPLWTRGRTRPVTDAKLSLSKLRHDLSQLDHLREKNICSDPISKIIPAYEAAIQRLSTFDVESRSYLTAEEEQTLGRAFARLIHVADAPRIKRALSSSWDRQLAQEHYLVQRPNVVVIDDFLTHEALESLLRFCQDSTIWAGNRYAHGRLSSLFFTGFNAPLILQIAEEIRNAFPTIIGDFHPLRQLWAFKNTEFLPADSTIHADFAAVNVNFWITPDAANLNADTGGMIVYDLEAPFAWNFRQYNEGADLVREIIARHKPNSIRIPYRQNRAVVFNSDLFHATEAVCFNPEYLGCRINVTMLYGDRTQDEHHAEPNTNPDQVAANAWRSASFSRVRK